MIPKYQGQEKGNCCLFFGVAEETLCFAQKPKLITFQQTFLEALLNSLGITKDIYSIVVFLLDCIYAWKVGG